MLTNAKAQVLLTTIQVDKDADLWGMSVLKITVDDFFDAIRDGLIVQSSDPVEASPCPSNLVNVIYTSGSSGKPKGIAMLLPLSTYSSLLHCLSLCCCYFFMLLLCCYYKFPAVLCHCAPVVLFGVSKCPHFCMFTGVMIPYLGYVSLMYWLMMHFGITEKDKASQALGAAFDPISIEIWPFLLCGASITIMDDETKSFPEKLLTYLREYEITICLLPTPIAELVLGMNLPEDLPLRILYTGGDKLHRGSVEGS